MIVIRLCDMRHFDLKLWVCYLNLCTIITFETCFCSFLSCPSCFVDASLHSILPSNVVFFWGTQDVVPTIKAAVAESPWRLWWVGLLYAVQNLLYFVCLQYTSAAAYQVLSAMADARFLFKRILQEKKQTRVS